MERYAPGPSWEKHTQRHSNRCDQYATPSCLQRRASRRECTRSNRCQEQCSHILHPVHWMGINMSEEAIVRLPNDDNYHDDGVKSERWWVTKSGCSKAHHKLERVAWRNIIDFLSRWMVFWPLYFDSLIWYEVLKVIRVLFPSPKLRPMALRPASTVPKISTYSRSMLHL